MAGALPVAWLDGAFVALADARISPLDRGFLFGDAVYEVLPVYAGRPFLAGPHLARLARSLAQMAIPNPRDAAGWVALILELVARNGGGDMSVYLQVSRGAEDGRNHAAPAGLAPTVFLMAMPPPAPNPALAADGAAAITLDDPRWARCDIKSTALLANVFAKNEALRAHAREAILVSGGWLREGASSSVLVVLAGAVHAPPDGPEILPGTTRELALALAREAGLAVVVAPVAAARLAAADEILLCNASGGLTPVTRLDGRPVGDGRPGPVWRRLAADFEAYRLRAAGTPPL
jgi:D-alanine transaminase